MLVIVQYSIGAPTQSALLSLVRALSATSRKRQSRESRESRLKLMSRIPRDNLLRDDEDDRDERFTISMMTYNSVDEELFFVNGLDDSLVSTGLHIGDPSDVYNDLTVFSMCHVSDPNTLLVCSNANGFSWILALVRGHECDWPAWHEVHRMQTDKKASICCTLSDSRVLVGKRDSAYMELFRVNSGPRIAFVHRIHVYDKYMSFSATNGSDTLVAMSYSDQSVHVHRLCGYLLEELSRVQLEQSFEYELLWLGDRLAVVEFNKDTRSHLVTEFGI